MLTLDLVIPIFSLFTYLGFTALFAAIAYLDKCKPFFLFSIALFLSTLSGIFDGFAMAGQHAFFYELTVFFAVVSVGISLWGAHLFTQKKGSFKRWIAVLASAYATHIILQTLGLPLTVKHTPLSISFFIIYSVQAHKFYKYSFALKQRFFAQLTAASFFLLGMFVLFYPEYRTLNSPTVVLIPTLLLQFLVLALLSTHFTMRNEILSESRSTLKTYIDDSPLGILVCDPQFCIVACNPYMEKLLGIPSTLLLGKPLSPIISPQFHTTLVETIQTQTSKHLAPEILIQGTQNSRIPVRISWTHQADGNLLLFCENISNEKVAKRKQEEMQQLILRSSKLASIGELAASVAHEINTPLAIIRASAQSASTTLTQQNPGELKSALEASLQRIIQGSEKISTVVRGLLSAARSGETSQTQFDLRTTVGDTVNFLSIMLSKEQISTHVVLSEEPVWTFAVAEQISQVVTNLVSNARDALQNCTPKIIRVSCYADDGFACISVQDTGSGMDSNVASKIFEQFFSTKPRGQGTGLGLSLSRKMAESNGGTLNFTTSPGFGSTFTLKLPLQPAAQTTFPISEATPKHDSPAPRMTQANQKSILLVDDEPAILEILREYLNSEGYTAICASSFAEAKKKIADHEFQCVFTDYVLDIGTGADILKAVREKYSSEQCKVFVLSGYSKNDKIQADGHLQKPFTFEQIHNAIEGVLS